MKVSIITVCYNSALVLKTAITSVLSQSYQDIEYIIIDGSSTDGTFEIIKSFREQINKFVCEPDQGIYDAMNKGLVLATGDVIGILNSDDFYPNSYIISEVVKAFSVNPNIGMVLGNVDFVHPKNIKKLVRHYSCFHFSSWHMRFGFMPAHSATFFKRSIYKKIGQYRLGYEIGADFEWFVRAFYIHKIQFICVNKTFVYMRQGGVSTSGLKSYWISSKEQIKALQENNVYSNILFVLIRLPIKFYHKLTRNVFPHSRYTHRTVTQTKDQLQKPL